MQALADILELPVNVPRNPRHAGAIGTAYCALIGLGYCSSYEDAAANIEIEHAFRPRPEAIPVYRKSYDVFKELYSILKPVFQKMQ
jgi:xylulokinase